MCVLFDVVDRPIVDGVDIILVSLTYPVGELCGQQLPAT